MSYMYIPHEIEFRKPYVFLHIRESKRNFERKKKLRDLRKCFLFAVEKMESLRYRNLPFDKRKEIDINVCEIILSD